MKSWIWKLTSICNIQDKINSGQCHNKGWFSAMWSVELCVLVTLTTKTAETFLFSFLPLCYCSPSPVSWGDIMCVRLHSKTHCLMIQIELDNEKKKKCFILPGSTFKQKSVSAQLGGTNSRDERARTSNKEIFTVNFLQQPHNLGNLNINSLWVHLLVYYLLFISFY